MNKNGKRPLVFKRSDGFEDMPVDVPCGQCIGCRLERSRQWAVRCEHEASLYSDNCFLTLTFNDDNLPDSNSISVRDVQLFMKRLRKKFKGLDAVERDGKITYPIRFFACGEYGDKNARPHYHVCLFNFDFSDKVLYRVDNNNRLYTSNDLMTLWPYGFSIVGALTFQSAAYVARYITKKVTGDVADDHYSYVNNDTGEIFDRVSEFVTMSRRPGIGSDWYDKYKDDVFMSDTVIVNGVKCRPPSYYSVQLEKTDTKSYNLIKRRRATRASIYSEDNTPDRLKVREKVQSARMAMLPRRLEEE